MKMPYKLIFFAGIVGGIILLRVEGSNVQRVLAQGSSPTEILKCSFNGDPTCGGVAPTESPSDLIFRETATSSKGLYTGNVVYDFWDHAKNERGVAWEDSTTNPVVPGIIDGSRTGASVYIADSFSLGPGGAVLSRAADNNTYEHTFFMYPSALSGATPGFVQGAFTVTMPSITPTPSFYPTFRFEAKISFSHWPNSVNWEGIFKFGKRIPGVGNPITWLSTPPAVLYHGQTDSSGIVNLVYEFPSATYQSEYAGQTYEFILRVEANIDRYRLLFIEPQIKSYYRTTSVVVSPTITPTISPLIRANFPPLSYLTPSSLTTAGFGKTGSVSMWVRPLVDIVSGADPQVMFQMMGVDAVGKADSTNRLLLLIQGGNILEFGAYCQPVVPTGQPTPTPLYGGVTCETVSVTNLDQTVPNDHALWKKGEWHQVAISWSDTFGMSLYVDGGLVARNVKNNRRFTSIPDRFFIGNRYTGEYPFDGIIKDVRFYDHTISDFEVEQLYKSDYTDPTHLAGGTAIVTSTGFGDLAPISGIPQTRANTSGTVELTYTIPLESYIAAGGGIKVKQKLRAGGMWGINWTASTFNFQLTAANSSNPVPSPKPPGSPGYPLPYDFGLRLVTESYATISAGLLSPGDKIKITLPSQSPVWASFDDPNVVFDVSVDRGGNRGGFFYDIPFASQPKIRVVAKSVTHLTATTPSVYINSQPFTVVVSALDQDNNPNPDYRGTVQVYLNSYSGTPLRTHSFTASDNGHFAFNLSSSSFSPVNILWIRDGESAGALEAKSNVFHAYGASLTPAPEYKLYWGDLHMHSYLSDGSKTPEKTYEFARDVGNLDFGALGDHAVTPYAIYNSSDFGNFFDTTDWIRDLALAETYNRPSDPTKPFIAFPGYEFGQGGQKAIYACMNERRPAPPACNDGYTCTGLTGGGIDWNSFYQTGTFDGDWNVYFNPDGASSPLPFWSPNTLRELTDKALDWTDNETNGNAGKVIIIPHWGGRLANVELFRTDAMATPKGRKIRDFVPKLFPAIEITSSHTLPPCSFEGWARKALNNAPIGFMASSDNHAGVNGVKTTGYIGVWARSFSRNDIFDAIIKRHTIATSNPTRPYLKASLTANSQTWLMGDDVLYPVGVNPTLSIDIGNVYGVQKVEIVQVKNDGTVVTVTSGDNTSSYFSLSYPSGSFAGGPIDFSIASKIYVKATLRDGGFAWSSPFFVSISSTPVFSFTTKLNGIMAPGVVKAFDITFHSTSDQTFTISATSESRGVFSFSNLPLTGLIPGTYTVYIKDKTLGGSSLNHLRKRMGDVVLTAGGNIAPVIWSTDSNYFLKPGDFNGDNIMTMVDITKLLSVYISSSVPVAPSNRQYDVNGDQVITIDDITLTIPTYTDFTVYGD